MSYSAFASFIRMTGRRHKPATIRRSSGQERLTRAINADGRQRRADEYQYRKAPRTNPASNNL
jgi:hypothetical protein